MENTKRKRGNTKSRRNQEGGLPPQGWSKDLIGESMFAAHWIMKRLPGLPRSALVFSHQRAADNPLGSRQAEDGGWTHTQNHCCWCARCEAPAIHVGQLQKQPSEEQVSQNRWADTQKKSGCHCQHKAWNTPVPTLRESQQGRRWVQARPLRSPRDCKFWGTSGADCQ